MQAQGSVAFFVYNPLKNVKIILRLCYTKTGWLDLALGFAYPGSKGQTLIIGFDYFGKRFAEYWDLYSRSNFI